VAVTGPNKGICDIGVYITAEQLRLHFMSVEKLSTFRMQCLSYKTPALYRSGEQYSKMLISPHQIQK